MLNSTANSSHFFFFLWSEVAMVYPRKTLGLYLITRKHKITKLLPSSVGLSAYNIIPLSFKLQCTKVDTEANRLSTHQAKSSPTLHIQNVWPGHNLFVKQQLLKMTFTVEDVITGSTPDQCPGHDLCIRDCPCRRPQPWRTLSMGFTPKLRLLSYE